MKKKFKKRGKMKGKNSIYFGLCILMFISCGRTRQEKINNKACENGIEIIDSIKILENDLIPNVISSDTVFYEKIPIEIINLRELENNEEICFAQNISFHDFLAKIRSCCYTSYLNINSKKSKDTKWHFISCDIESIQEVPVPVQFFYNASENDYYIVFYDWTEEGDNRSIYHFSKENDFSHIGYKNVNLKQWEYYLQQYDGYASLMLKDFSTKLYKINNKVHYALVSKKGKTMNYSDSTRDYLFSDSIQQKEDIEKIKEFEKTRKDEGKM